MATNTIFQELEQLLKLEREALRVLDTAAIAEAAQRKQELTDELRHFIDGGSATGMANSESVERLRTLAQQNQVLLAHAKACVQSALELSTGVHSGYAPPPGTQTSGPPRAARSVSPMRLDMRG